MPLPFLESQRLFALRPDADPREAVHPERFHAARHGQNERDDNGPATPDEELWAELPREAFLDGGEWEGCPLHRIALINDAGIGKTYNLKWLHYKLNKLRQPVVAFTLKIAELPPVAELLPKVLLDKIQSAGNSDVDPERIKRELRRKRDSGRIVLLIDGLDQVRDDLHGKDCLDRLAALLDPTGEWAKCRIVVAGRPFAISNHWNRLFSSPEAWHFVQIAEFDEGQQRAVLGTLADGSERFDAIPEDARPLFTVPRVLEYIAGLPEERLPGLNTVADVYWEATGHMLTQAIQQEKLSPSSVLRYRAVLGALAFGMYSDIRTDPKSGRLQPNLDRITALQTMNFQVDVYNRVAESFRTHRPGAYSFEDHFEEDCRTLSRLNAVLHHGWLDMDAVGAPNADLLWRNASLQEFFAAYWATRWGTPADLALLRDWIVNPLTGEKNGFYWFWRYASEMPDEALNTERTPRATWVKAMAPLYDQKVVRSTEFIYRSWDRMADTEPRRTFLAEFQDLLAGKRGSDDQRRIAREMMAAFVPLVGTDKPGDTGTFWMGAGNDDSEATDDEKPRHRVTLSPFRMHKFCVMNVEYELFFLEHRSRRWKAGEQHPLAAKPNSDDRCPVLDVTWYDAFCFAAWCGCRLPTEAEWEYANRAGTETPYSVGDGRTLTPEVCRFDQPWKSGSTIPVDGKPANCWGLYQMSGNVWEWCWDWFGPYGAEDQTDPCRLCKHSDEYRVLRGGSWGDFARYCRAANRFWDGPRLRLHDFGFRLCLPGPA